ncbi:hypothetical protein A9236_04985 [Polynucleobacter sp. QLW-P1DATA-2]|jgi:uncharacterized protein (DUF2147 family)|uniref:DUF2147 domain-containing protein n=1 Tax=unclassified Polynucleobacter TaxID=2640945 RepID=UPI0008F815AA|nr:MULTISPECIES: DUF2147 domain-containing protein [unclassified Polynucleobacter]OIM98750.1 hypothetical protein A9235_07795 [Polynucleobacter sp. MWH-Tro8-2-5-gr]OIN00584.1 hypothetical protein A9236_04985 [Polynucleobacter sp. QLW-P1DATA-2]
MKKSLLFLFTASFLSLASQVASSQSMDSIAGTWKTFDDDTNQPAAIILITEKNGLFSGVITKLLDPNALQTCEKCSDSRKGKSVLGMEILAGLKKTGDSYTGGQILDPDDGEIYRAEMKLKDQGSKLDLRAYIGIPLLGRTQTWIRER